VARLGEGQQLKIDPLEFVSAAIQEGLEHRIVLQMPCHG